VFYKAGYNGFEMKKILIAVSTLLALGAVGGGAYYYTQINKPPIETRFVQNVREETTVIREITKTPKTPTVSLTEPGTSARVDNPKHVYQTFNNCGPATLSMILAWHGVNVGQQELGQKMRPFQNPQGDNDDKTIFTYEFVEWAREYGLEAIDRVNGDIDILKKFTANGIPVVVKTWLNTNEDVGHFRLVLGFDEERKVIIQDDSYHGPNKRVSYFDFLTMWQPFNYDYIIVYTPDMKDKIYAIIGAEIDETVSWSNALKRAEKEKELDPENPYPAFNISTATYHTGDFSRSVTEFESVHDKLPRRMLWYQIEPIKAYKELGNYDKVFSISRHITENGNRAFSELYLLMGEIYLEQGNPDAAKQQFELAVRYNINLKKAQTALKSL
jgi:tetratricopeptide (TPR) repeat protein